MKFLKCQTMFMVIIPTIFIMIHGPCLYLAAGASCIADDCDEQKKSNAIGLSVLVIILEIIIIILVVMTSKNCRRIGSRITLRCNCYVSGHDMDAKRKCVVVLVLVIILASYFTVVTSIFFFAKNDKIITDFGLKQKRPF